MAEVDHAMLAAFACVEADGSLTVVGGHRTTFEVAGVPGQHVLCVAGRLLVARREPPPTLGLAALTPHGEVPDVASWSLEVPCERGREGRLPVSFAATLVAPAPCEGAYALVLSVNGDVVRTLAFTVVDTSVVDTSVVDTSVVDTSVVDTSVVDTSVVDTSVGDADGSDGPPGRALTGGRAPG